MTECNESFPRLAVVPAAGWGTRFLPATKAIPKELLPVVDTPGVEMVAVEAALAGAKELALVVSPYKTEIIKYFQPHLALEESLQQKQKLDILAKVKVAPNIIKTTQVIQKLPQGLGHAIAQAEQLLTEKDTAISVLLPDDIVLPTGILNKMIQVRNKFGGSVLCAFEVPLEKVSSYGIFSVADIPATGLEFSVKRVTGMVEKPTPTAATSNLAAAGRYILDRKIFAALNTIKPGTGGEWQLTDAIAALIAQGEAVHVVVHDGVRHDVGNPGGYLKAAIDVALDRPEYAEELRQWLSWRLNN